MRVSAAVWAALAVCLTLACGCRHQPAPTKTTLPAPSGGIQETRLGEMADDLLTHKVSPDGLHLAWAVRRGLGETVLVDGQRGPSFSAVGPIVNRVADMGWHVCAEFSDDSWHVAYYGRRGGSWQAVIDGQRGAKYHGIRMDAGRVFSPKGDRYAYAALWRGKWAMVIDGKLVGRYNSVSAPTWSDDGRRIAFIGTNRGGDELVVDGRITARAGQIDPHSPAFSPDGQRLAYIEDRPHSAVVADDKRWPLKGLVLYSRLRFSPDSRHLAYVEGSKREYYGGTWRVVVDGKPGKPYETVSKLGFTSAGEVHYGARRTSHEVLVVIGDRESPLYDAIEPSPFFEPLGGYWGRAAPIFSPDGKHNAYGVAKGGKGWVVLDGRKGPTFLGVGEPVFGPDGRSVAYCAQVRKDEWALVRDGRPGPQLPEARRRLAFSPDGRRLAYAACISPPKGKRQVVAVVDGKPGPPHENVSAPFFSADSRHVAYVARDGKREWVVVDGRDGPHYDRVFRDREICDAQVSFHPDGSVQYVAQRGDTIYRVRRFPPRAPS
ncbi:MAG: hypothetical protein FJX75_02170 [Armatimonadetes bacterium]|nr:hypothetical protein [Armatimonadota bacterium]